MIVTKLEKWGKNKVKVFLDDCYRFTLYDKEIKRYALTENEKLTEVLANELYNNAVKKAKQKAMALLKHMDRTEAELVRKLEMSGYTNEIIKEAIEYVISYQYVDDLRYASNYIRHRKESKSRRQLVSELKQKGISALDIESALESEYESEEEAIKREIFKKYPEMDSLSREEKQKLASKLFRKGYGMELIRQYVRLEH